MFDAAALRTALAMPFLKLAPRHIVKSPVMAIVLWLGTLLSAVDHRAGCGAPASAGAVTAILLITVLFGNFAEAVAEARGRGQAASLRRARKDLVAPAGSTPCRTPKRRGRAVPAAELRPAIMIVIGEGELVPADGEIIEGLATINEAAVTGESAPVLREAGTDRFRRDRRHQGAVRRNRGARHRRARAASSTA
jgi:K+-transporting ATPase ATPase B chain